MKIERKYIYTPLPIEDIVEYGSHSTMHKQNASKMCTKVYRKRINDSYRNIIKLNYIDLDKIDSLKNNPQFLMPLKLVLNRQDILQSIEMPFLPYKNMWQIKKENYMTKKYLDAINDLIKMALELTEKGIIITDFNLSNLLVDENNKVIFVDNDFSIRKQNQILLRMTQEITNSIYIKFYQEMFCKNLNEDYNKYMLINILAILLLNKKQTEN